MALVCYYVFGLLRLSCFHSRFTILAALQLLSTLVTQVAGIAYVYILRMHAG